VGWHAAADKRTDLVLTRCGSRCGTATGKASRSTPASYCTIATPAAKADSSGRRNTSMMEV
jgi:hypothetical protein